LNELNVRGGFHMAWFFGIHSAGTLPDDDGSLKLKAGCA
jgi:hypothetical protein